MPWKLRCEFLQGITECWGFLTPAGPVISDQGVVSMDENHIVYGFTAMPGWSFTMDYYAVGIFPAIHGHCTLTIYQALTIAAVAEFDLGPSPADFKFAERALSVVSTVPCCVGALPFVTAQEAVYAEGGSPWH
jgi:hypothetical protein